MGFPLDKSVLFWSILLFLIAVLAFLQIVYIHTHFYEIKKLFTRKATRVDDVLDSLSKDDHAVRIYPLVIQLNVMHDIQRVFEEKEEDVKSLFQERQFTLPFICEQKIEQWNVSMNKVGVLAFQRDQGGTQFLYDIVNHNFQYIILYDEVFTLYYYPDLTEKFFAEQVKNTDSRGTFVVYLFPLRHFKVQEENNEQRIIDDSCTFRVRPFMGEFKEHTSGGSSFALNIVQQVIPEQLHSETYLPIHVMAYKTLSR